MFRSPRRRQPAATTEQATDRRFPMLQPAPELLGSDLFRPAPQRERSLPDDHGLFDIDDEEPTGAPVEDAEGLFVPFDELPRVEVSEAEASDPFACFDLPATEADPAAETPSASVRVHQAMLPRWRGRVLTD